MAAVKKSKTVLWRMSCPWCARKKAYSIMLDAKQRLYARCSFDCGISFAEVGIVRWVLRNPSQDIDPIHWKEKEIVDYLKNHPAF